MMERYDDTDKIARLIFDTVIRRGGKLALYGVDDIMRALETYSAEHGEASITRGAKAETLALDGRRVRGRIADVRSYLASLEREYDTIDLQEDDEGVERLVAMRYVSETDEEWAGRLWDDIAPELGTKPSGASPRVRRYGDWK